LTFREKWMVLLPVTLLLFAIGIYPRWLLKPMEPSVLATLQLVKKTAVAGKVKGTSPLARQLNR
jgi:NADH:ubiquinone oxidoreductase subunit 4 (subunit M)